jgi:succinoglycan biosynthesis protein ExoA
MIFKDDLMEKEKFLPFVSIIVPVYNEAAYIKQCLESILRNEYPRDRFEILVIDGGSTDGTHEIIEQMAKQYPQIIILKNYKRIQSVAMNIGIRNSRGEIIIRMDAHTLYAPDYIRRCVELLETTDAANVGGVLRAVGTNYISKIIAVAVTTPFGIGNAYYRYAEKEMWVDTLFPGAWRKSTLEELGGFNEEWAVNEDYELNYRLRKAGGKILLSPKIKCWYYVRPSLKALTRQYFRYGFWRAKTVVTYPDSLRWRQLAPPGLVISLLLSLGILPVKWMLGIIAPALYLAANLLASTWTASRKGWKYLPLLPFVFATIHLSWGIGFLVGLFRWGIPRIINWRGENQ